MRTTVMSAFGTGQLIGILFWATVAVLILQRVMSKGGKREAAGEGTGKEGPVVIDPKGELAIVEEAGMFRVDKMVFPTRGAASTYLRERIRQRDGA